MNSYDIHDYEAAGCFHTWDNIMTAVWLAVKGKVCTTGCYSYQDGRCAAYQKLTVNEKRVSAPTRISTQYGNYTDTVREEAARRQVSIKQVRRERRDAANQKQ